MPTSSSASANAGASTASLRNNTAKPRGKSAMPRGRVPTPGQLAASFANDNRSMQSETTREMARAAQGGGIAPPGYARRAPSPTGGPAQQFTQEPSQATAAASSPDLTYLCRVHRVKFEEVVVRLSSRFPPTRSTAVSVRY